jgi:2-octaprenylphenol hydroxylase
MKHYDVVIIGGGMVGASLAALLAESHMQVAVVEAFIPTDFDVQQPYDLRVSAINHFSRQVLIDVGAWPLISAMRVSPYEKMHIWEAQANSAIDFDAAEIGEAQLGHIIENRIIQLGLLESLVAYKNVELISAARLQTLRKSQDKVYLNLDNGQQLSATLAVGADGASSQLRYLANIAVQRNDYGQSGLVTVVKTEKSHQSTAWQCFLSTGPVAFLPLGKQHSAIVWTLPSDKADAVFALDDNTFKQQLAQAVENKLGAIESISTRATFPLRGSQASHYIQARIALIGDAAHTIHPLAGLGVNLGFKDAAKLAEVLIATPIERLGDVKVLRRYERARRGDNVLTMRAMETFRVLFQNRLAPIQNLRTHGLNWINQTTTIKRLFIQHAMGK